MEKNPKLNANAQGASVIDQNNENKLTTEEQMAFNGLMTFLSSDKETRDNDDEWLYDIQTFCFKGNDLFAGLDNFTGGRFKCDFGLHHLGSIYRDAVATHPHMANAYIYEYSQLMELFVGIYNAEAFIRKYASVFENLAEKSEFFEIKPNLPN